MADPTSPEPAETGVFVSYASIDLGRVRGLVAALEQSGVPVWFDRDGIAGGANYGPEIVAAIRSSPCLLLCCSAAAFASRNVRQEVALAWKHERPILPLLLEPVTVPDDLAYWLEAAQWVELLDRPEDDWLPAVLRALGRFGVVTAVADRLGTLAASLDTSERVRLPTPLTALLGRDAEIREVAGRLADHRLVTLTGPGGVGKTRLAIEAARTAAPAFPDGVTFVDLAPIRDPGLVLPTIGRALGLGDAGPVSLVDALATAIGDRRALLVLDNLEQVLGAAPEIATTLSRCPRLAVLATSRAPLGVRGEHVVPVAPLAVPDSTTGANLAVLAAVPAVALFAARAAGARPGFALTAENAGAVGAICARLDGLPLAIELAASRIKLLPPDQLLARLDRALPTLTGGARDLPDRQRTQRDAIAWSHDLLSPDEQALFRRLAVFAGGWTMGAAESVCNPDGPLAIFDTLASLVDNSLVQLLGGEEPRFGFLETVREYAAERLDASGEENGLREGHAAWLLALAERGPTTPLAGADVEWLRRLAAEHANIRAALSWLERAGRGDDLLRLAGKLCTFWYFSGLLREGRYWLAQALELAPLASPALRAPVLVGLGHNAHYLGEAEAAAGWLTEGADMARHLGDAVLEALGIFMLGIIAEDQGDHDRAESHFLRALHRFDDGEMHWSRAVTIYHLGIQAFARGDAAAAAARWEQAATIGKQRGMDMVVAWSLNYLGLAAAYRGDTLAASVALRESLTLGTGDLLRNHLDQLLASITVLAAARGMPEVAARMWGAVQAEQAATGQRFDLPELLVFERTEEQLRAVLGQNAYTEALADGRALGRDAVLAEVEAVLIEDSDPTIPPG